MNWKQHTAVKVIPQCAFTNDEATLNNELELMVALKK